MDVEVDVNMILQKDMLAESPLQQETVYQVFCYAEDDWKIQAGNLLIAAVDKCLQVDQHTFGTPCISMHQYVRVGCSDVEL